MNTYQIVGGEIKPGDYCLNSFDGSIWQYMPSPCPMPYWGNKKTLTKVTFTPNVS